MCNEYYESMDDKARYSIESIKDDYIQEKINEAKIKCDESIEEIINEGF